MTNMFKRILLMLGLLLPAPAVAGVPCTLPFTLINGTIADATQVMANYNALVTCLGNAAAAGVNSDITVLSGLTTPLSPAEGGASVFFGGTSGGSANAQTVSVTPNGFALTTNFQAIFIAGFTNTGPMTLNVSGTGVKNVFHNTALGSEAFIGGEITAGQVVHVSYDGTQYQIVNSPQNGGGFGTLTALASAATTDLGTIASHHVNVTGSATITSFGSTASTNFPMYIARFAAGATITSNANITIPGSANIVTADADVALLRYTGGGNWRILFYQKFNGQALTPSVLDVQNFTGNGTWTRATGVGVVNVFICGSGGGGGGGGRVAAATAVTGGGGGGGGYCAHVTYKAADAGASQTVTIGGAGSAGAGATVNGNAGTAGGAGGTSTFGTLLSAFGGGGGQGGAAAAVGGGGGGGGGPSTAGLTSSTVGSGGGGDFAGNSGGTGTFVVAICNGQSSANSAAPAPGCPGGGAGGGSNQTILNFTGNAGGPAGMYGPGGGGGASMTTDNTGHAAGNGGKSAGCPTAPAGGAAGNNPGGSTAASFNYLPGCGGGGGGSSAAVSAGAGGAGTNAGGGGGGGAGDNVNGGNGGAGGPGFAIVISW